HDTPIPALLLICPAQMAAHDWAPIKWDLYYRHLQHFANDAAAKGIALQIEIIESWGKAGKAVKQFATHHQLTEVHINAEYPVHEQRRDRAVQGVLQLSHIQLKAHHGSVIVPPVITTQSGSVYQKFTP